MRNSEKEIIIKNAIMQYRGSRTKEELMQALNMMENVEIMINNSRSWYLKGVSILRQSIKEAYIRLNKT